jgi:hypothetical protein
MLTGADLYAQFRGDVVDQLEPYLWSDAEVLDYADDAQKMFCRLIGGLADASSPLTVIAYTDATDWVDTSPLILKPRDAYDVLTGRPIEVVNYENLNSMDFRFDGRRDIPRYLVTGMEEHRARLYPFPAVTGSIQLVVDRLPLLPVDDPDSRLEVADQHKNGLVMWMKARAYKKQDAETRNDRLALQYDQEFHSYCAMAKAEKDRAKHRTRVVGYGGIVSSGSSGRYGRSSNSY